MDQTVEGDPTRDVRSAPPTLPLRQHRHKWGGASDELQMKSEAFATGSSAHKVSGDNDKASELKHAFFLFPLLRRNPNGFVLWSC